MPLADLETRLLRLASVPAGLVKQGEPKADVARSLLQDAETVATACFHAVQAICGPGSQAWEPESIWLTLERANIDVPLVNRDKYLAASTLLMVPAFWFEMNAFENTVMAFNNEQSDPEVLHEATPAQIGWAVYEAELLFRESGIEEKPEFDREPEGYTAVVLHRAGFVLAPPLLAFAQDALDDLNCDGYEVSKTEIEDAWEALRKADLAKHAFSDSPLETQLARLTAVQLYIWQRSEQYEADMKRLRR